MADVTYSVSFSSMSVAIDAAKARAASIQSSLETMNQTTGQNLANWTGDAQEAYRVAYKQCMDQALKMPQTLEAARSTLTSIADNYQSAESQVSKAFGV